MTANTISGASGQKGVIAAVMAGVAAYIEEQERAAELLPRRRKEAVVTSLWPIFGRQEIMRMRTMWQRRLV